MTKDEILEMLANAETTAERLDRMGEAAFDEDATEDAVTFLDRLIEEARAVQPRDGVPAVSKCA